MIRNLTTCLIVYGDFEALLRDTKRRSVANTRTTHTRRPVRYVFSVKVSDDMPAELLERYGITLGSVAFAGPRLWPTRS